MRVSPYPHSAQWLNLGAMSHAAAISRVLRANPHFAPALGSGVMMVKQFGRECAVLSMQTNPLLVQARQFLEATYGVGQVRSLSGGVAGRRTEHQYINKQ